MFWLFTVVSSTIAIPCAHAINIFLSRTPYNPEFWAFSGAESQIITELLYEVLWYSRLNWAMLTLIYANEFLICIQAFHCLLLNKHARFHGISRKICIQSTHERNRRTKKHKEMESIRWDDMPFAVEVTKRMEVSDSFAFRMEMWVNVIERPTDFFFIWFIQGESLHPQKRRWRNLFAHHAHNCIHVFQFNWDLMDLLRSKSVFFFQFY